ncbi:MAG TPA: hypothetical protein DDW94_09955 [Deltaproteobacteria bacterium]|nr:MAG: hypothetical protein A2Z79_12550 [Deltaproteobacteria bacterium GWA2_55_82]OGQ63998.1 MAG: hypothetical protein A3I81_08080 [Deltaproteobacteria bacterium RIFCSPLOWO2_02_FULL_55_12]OIJ73431.1 MAG: hypothetical protein A2V21_303620 [Deltaproteobacteria bacterium GWC2_55_46]HBG47294.1 hypothetical protein [Deltaproteobacteria bacterium]HCY10060.1 hypothetical protein [Deltaproteobacteria bacterium]
MKIYRLPQLADSAQDGTYLLGPHELHSRAIYMVYGKLRPGETPKKLAPENGTEAIIFVLKGNMKTKTGKTAVSVGPGEAFHLKGPDIYYLESAGAEEAVYIEAGGNVVAGFEPMAIKPPEVPQAEPAPQKAAQEEPEFIITREAGDEGS